MRVKIPGAVSWIAEAGVAGNREVSGTVGRSAKMLGAGMAMEVPLGNAVGNGGDPAGGRTVVPSGKAKVLPFTTVSPVPLGKVSVTRVDGCGRTRMAPLGRMKTAFGGAGSVRVVFGGRIVTPG